MQNAEQKADGQWSSTAGVKIQGKDAAAWAIQAAKFREWRNLADQYGLRRTKTGYDLELTRAVSCRVNIPVIASGGAGTMEHFSDAFELGEADAVLAASFIPFW